LPDRYVLYFGSNKPHKNVPRLVQAFAQARIEAQGSRIELVVAGHWDERYPEAKQAAERLGLKDTVKFIGPVKDADLPALYGGAELFVFPSEYEGFGLPVLEAMACGAPVVCSSRSSLPEVAGDAALLCDPQDVESLARTIEQALTDRDLRAALQQRGLARAAQFSWEQAAQRTLGVYRSTGEV
jgi:alpha-1,3-rhamnosyl/mannosyltransferase